MSLLIPIAMFGWIPFVFGLFAWLGARRGAIAGFLLAWMLLPQYKYPLPGLPDYSKTFAASIAILMVTILWRSDLIKKYKFHWLDLAVIFYCLSSMMASLSNGLGIYDGISESQGLVVAWGIPYFIGRIFCDSLEGLKELVWGIFLCGLLYIPFCLIEIRMSPQLHNWVYGYHPHEFGQSLRWGGYRPVVFMNHGLMVGMWMTAASLMGFALWMSGAFREKIKWLPVPPIYLLGALFMVTVLCKSAGALILLLVGMTLLYLATKGWKLPLLIVLILPVLYIYGRTSGTFDGTPITDQIARVNEERAGSMQFRFDNETILMEKALDKPLFGWGGWGRSRVYDEEGKDISITDGFWIIQLGLRGSLGLASAMAVFILPVLYFLFKVPMGHWRHEAIMIVGALVILLALYQVDNLLNDMFMPVYVFTAGGLVGWLTKENPLAELFHEQEGFTFYTPKTRIVV